MLRDTAASASSHILLCRNRALAPGGVAVSGAQVDAAVKTLDEGAVDGGRDVRAGGVPMVEEAAAS
jgi:hypothetical protein